MLKKGFSIGHRHAAFKFMEVDDYYLGNRGNDLYSLIGFIINSDRWNTDWFRERYAFLLEHNAEFECFRRQVDQISELWVLIPDGADRAMWALYYD